MIVTACINKTSTFLGYQITGEILLGIQADPYDDTLMLSIMRSKVREDLAMPPTKPCGKKSFCAVLS